jgi:hypothetical protein
MTKRRWAPAVAVAVSLLGLASIARRGGPTWAVGDGALIELYTIHATHGRQLLGAYSQYGWHHPGPLLFYLLAPVYVLGGRSSFALQAGALALNLGSVSLVAWVVGRSKRVSAPFAVTLFGLLVAYLLRLPGLLTSAWNPHPPVLAFVALLVLCAACVAHSIAFLPVALLVASFVMQAHVALVPVTAAILVLTIGVLLAQARYSNDTVGRRSLLRWGLLSIVILELVWLPPVAEQLATYPGNMTAIGRFFFSGEPGQQTAVAWQAWNSMLWSLVRSDFSLAKGWGFSGSPAVWPALLGSACVPSLIAVMAWAWRSRRPFHCSLAAAALTASIVSFWSIERIHGTIGDYQIFWVSALGVVNAALIVGALLTPVADRFLSAPSSFAITQAAAAALVIATAAIGGSELVAATRTSSLPRPTAAVKSLSEQVLRTLPSTGNRRPLVRAEDGHGDIFMGVLLEMTKLSVPFTVDAEIAPLVGQSLSTTGDEDVLLTLCGPALHRQLIARRRNVTLASFEGERLFVDAVSLVDAPEYRK